MLSVCLALGFAAANIQKQFVLPPSLKYPAYDVKLVNEPLSSLDSFSTSQVVKLRRHGMPMECLIPENHENVDYEGVKALEDEEVLANARAAISELISVNYASTFDDVWGWFLSFNSTIIQFLPQRTDEPGVLEISPTSYQVSVGSPGKLPGQNLATAEPVVVEDKHMLMATFINGTICDLTGQPRTSRVFFTCDPNAVKGPLLKSVQEPYACVYEHVIGTDKLCAFPEFTRTLVQPNTILCAPSKDSNQALSNETEQPEHQPQDKQLQEEQAQEEQNQFKQQDLEQNMMHVHEEL